jgi:hypothetical protein
MMRQSCARAYATHSSVVKPDVMLKSSVTLS